MSATKNVFALKKGGRGGPSRVYKPKVVTEEDQAKLLERFVELPRELWPLLRHGTQVRYVTAEGEFRTGGYVADALVHTKPHDAAEVKDLLAIQTGFDSKGFAPQRWLVAYESIAKLYYKPDASAVALQASIEDVIRKFNAQMRKLAEYTKKLEARLAELEKR
jgi:hypothetical protein